MRGAKNEELRALLLYDREHRPSRTANEMYETFKGAARPKKANAGITSGLRKKGTSVPLPWFPAKTKKYGVLCRVAPTIPPYFYFSKTNTRTEPTVQKNPKQSEVKRIALKCNRYTQQENPHKTSGHQEISDSYNTSHTNPDSKEGYQARNRKGISAPIAVKRAEVQRDHFPPEIKIHACVPD